MSPRKELSPEQCGFLKGLLDQHGTPIEGVPYSVHLEPHGREVIVVLGGNFVHADEVVYKRLGPVLDGLTIFQAPREAQTSIPPFEITPDTNLSDLFGSQGSRIEYCLRKEGIDTVGKLREILNQEDGERQLLDMRNFGKKSLAEVKRVLGL